MEQDRRAHWDERYRTGDVPWDTGRPSPELMKVMAEEKIAPCRALELGCGTGTNSLWLGQQGFDVTGVDISPLAVQKAKDLASKVPVRFVQADVLANPDLGGPFAFFFDRGCYHVVRRTDADGYLQALDRATGPGSVGLVLAGNANEPRTGSGPPVVTEGELRGELGRLFDIVWLREFRFDPPPGTNENFLGWSCFLRKRAG